MPLRFSPGKEAPFGKRDRESEDLRPVVRNGGETPAGWRSGASPPAAYTPCDGRGAGRIRGCSKQRRHTPHKRSSPDPRSRGAGVAARTPPALPRSFHTLGRTPGVSTFARETGARGSPRGKLTRDPYLRHLAFDFARRAAVARSQNRMLRPARERRARDARRPTERCGFPAPLLREHADAHGS